MSAPAWTLPPTEAVRKILRRIGAAPPERCLRAAVAALRRVLGAEGAGVVLDGSPFGPGWRGRSPGGSDTLEHALEPGTRLVAVAARGCPRRAETILRDVAPIVRLALHSTGPLLPLGAEEGGQESQFPELVGKSRAMERLFEQMLRAAPLDLPLLIHGESGTGKELVARAVHRACPHRRGPWVPVHCGALPESLVEAELFGYRKGAFTGAASDRAGLLEEASGGTVFLDEIGEMSPSIQVKLLRFLQEGEVRRIGDRRPRRVEARVIAATHRNLPREVERGRFREDLFYRLHVLPLRVPPLRERGEDGALLAGHFLARISRRGSVAPKTLSERARLAVLEHPWPGNVRQLENAVQAAAVRAGSLPMVLQEHLELPPHGEDAMHLASQVARFEAGRVREALRREGGCRSRAAQRLGVSRQTLHNKIRKYGLDRE